MAAEYHIDIMFFDQVAVIFRSDDSGIVIAAGQKRSVAKNKNMVIARRLFKLAEKPVILKHIVTTAVS
jgi:hypothetical protein